MGKITAKAFEFIDQQSPTDSDSYVVEITENGKTSFKEICANPEDCNSIEELQLLAEVKASYEHPAMSLPISNRLDRFTSRILNAVKSGAAPAQSSQRWKQRSRCLPLTDVNEL
jgi:hypothetical protein